MSALVVYESMFGNTRTIAEAIAAGMKADLATVVVEVASAPDVLPADLDLLVVGGPTHAFGMTRAGTRGDAAGRGLGPVVSRGRGIREWLDGMEAPGTPRPAAVFDTRIDRPRVPGSAAKAAFKRLRRLGLNLVAAPETFWVRDVDGPLLDGEVDRAHDWGGRLGSLLPQVRTADGEDQDVDTSLPVQ